MAATDLLSEILEDAVGSDWDVEVLGEAAPVASPPVFHEDVAPAEAASVTHTVLPVPMTVQLPPKKTLWRLKSGQRRRLRAWKPKNAPHRKVQKNANLASPSAAQFVSGDIPVTAASSTQKSAYCVSSSEDDCVVRNAGHHASGSCDAGPCGAGTCMDPCGFSCPNASLLQESQGSLWPWGRSKNHQM